MIERNQPCPCGSGKKYKKCCGAGAGIVQATRNPAAATNAAATAGSRASGNARATGTPPAARNTATAASVPGPESPTRSDTDPASPKPATAADPEKPFLITTGRGLDSERTEAERKKHLRRRIQTRDMRGTLVYNSGAFFRPPNPGASKE